MSNLETYRLRYKKDDIYSYNLANKKILKDIKIKAYYNVDHGFNDFSDHAKSLSNSKLFLNSLFGFIDFISLF
jgi:hypothetical protein